MKEQDRVIRQLVRAAKTVMKSLEWAMVGTPHHDVWNTLYLAVKRAEGKKKLNEWMLRQRRAETGARGNDENDSGIEKDVGG